MQATPHTLTRFALLDGIQPPQLNDLAESLTQRVLRDGEIIFYENDLSNDIYFIESGQVEIFKGGHILTRLESGHEFGELSFLDGSVRSASARAVGSVELWILNRQTLEAHTNGLALMNALITNIALSSTERLRQTNLNYIKSQDQQLEFMEKMVKKLQKFSLLNGLTNDELLNVISILDSHDLQDQQGVFCEHETSDEIYFIDRGQIEIFKEDYTIAQLGAGEEFGELAFLDGAPRSASARAVGDTELFVLKRQAIRQLSNSDRILNVLISNIAHSNAERLKQGNINYVQALEKQVDTMRTQHDFGAFFIYTMVSYTIALLVNYWLWNSVSDKTMIYNIGFAWIYTLILIVPAAFLVWKLEVPLNQMGVTLQNWKKSVFEGVALSLVCLGVFAGLVTLLSSLELLKLNPSEHHSLWMLPNYFIHSYVQELYTRGFLQTAFQRFFNDKHGVKAVLLTSLLFGIVHIHFSLTAVVLTFIASIGFGFFYMRHYNLLGVTILHWAAGATILMSGIF